MYFVLFVQLFIYISPTIADSITITDAGSSTTMPGMGAVIYCDWTSDGPITHVDIYISDDAGSDWWLLAGNEPNDGTFDVGPKWRCRTADQCLLRVEDSSNPATFDVSDYFTWEFGYTSIGSYLTIDGPSVVFENTTTQYNCYYNIVWESEGPGCDPYPTLVEAEWSMVLSRIASIDKNTGLLTVDNVNSDIKITILAKYDGDSVSKAIIIKNSFPAPPKPYTEVYFSDDFEDGNMNGWDLKTPARWSVGDQKGRFGAYINTSAYTPGANDRLGEYAIINTYNHENFDLKFKGSTLEQLPVNAHADYCIPFNFHDDDDYFYLMINNAPGSSGLYQITNNTRIEVGLIFEDLMSDYNYHDWEIRKRGNQMWLFMDDNAIFYSDKVSGSAKFGIGSYNDAAVFDNVEIRVPETLQPYPLYNGFELIQNNAPVYEKDQTLSCSWGDYDNDGYEDLIVANAQPVGLILFRNLQGNGFEQINNSAIVTVPNSTFSAAWGDYDNDGLVDLYVAQYQGANNILFQNEGNGIFTSTGIIPPNGGNSLASCWSDYDCDGNLDLYVVNLNQINFLYKNNGDSTFTQISGQPEANGFLDKSYSAAWIDFDLDNDIDLFVSNLSQSKKLYNNNGDGTFTDVAAGDLTSSGPTLSSAWGDFNNDGFPDVFIPQNGDVNKLFINNGDGSFTQSDQSAVFTQTALSVMGVWEDIDNDGFLDLIVANEENNYSCIFINDQNGTFVPYTLNNRDGWSVTTADYDNDGDMDVYFGNPYGDNKLYKNTVGTANHWIRLACQGVNSNVSGIGSRIRVKAKLDGVTATWQTRQLTQQSSCGSQSMITAHFGLGQASIIDSIQIIWPSGKVFNTTHVQVDQILTIKESDVSKIEQIPMTPSTFSLCQNFPNPFNPETIISYSIPASMIVKLIVYNINGEEIDVLVNEEQRAGVYEVSWIAKDAAGKMLPSGLYIYKIVTDSYQKTRKMLLLR
jgi:hypothetical protein